MPSELGTDDYVLVGDYTLFLSSWKQPSGGIHGYLSHFLGSGDPTFQHIAIWTLLQLLESGDPKLIETINKSDDVMNAVRDISEKNVESEDESEEGEDGEAEVVALARRCLEISNSAGVSANEGRADGGDLAKKGAKRDPGSTDKAGPPPPYQARA